MQSATLPVLSIGYPISCADRLIGSPITWHYTGSEARRTLDVVVEAAGSWPVALQQPEGVVVGEVLELEQHVRPPGAQRGHELRQHRVVRRPLQPAMPAGTCSGFRARRLYGRI